MGHRQNVPMENKTRRVKNQTLPPSCGAQLRATVPAHSITLTKGTERPPWSRHTLG